MNKSIIWRFTFLGAIMVALPAFIVLQMVRIQLDPEQVEKITIDGEIWSWEWRTLTPARGQVFDRWGYQFAGNETVYEIGLELRYVENPETIARVLSHLLEEDYARVLGLASIKASDTAVYATVADYVTQEQIDRLDREITYYESLYGNSDLEDAPSLDGVVYSTHLARTYPEMYVASNILGFVSREGTGYFGVEQYYNNLLAGKSRTISISRNPNDVQDLPSVPNGANLILTIDRSIQRAMEDVIDQALKESGAESGTLVVLNPKTGEIMALATTPRMDLNAYWEYKEIFADGIPFNRAVSEAYEPGSVFKVLTMASALDSGVVTVDTVFVDTCMIEVGGVYIYNWNLGAWGPQTMLGCMQHSLNVCLAHVATLMGPSTFYSYMQAFGIGRLTGIDMAGETPGRLKVPGDSDWYAGDLGTNAFGQGVSVSPVQIASAISPLANDGALMTPHIVRSVVTDDFQHDIEQAVVSRPISAETAHIMTEMLAQSLEIESSDALVTGYRMAGKTGTAEIPTPFGYTSNETNASFVGWGPVDDPQFLVYVWLEKPTLSPWGSVVAAPVFRQAVEKLVILLDLPPDEIRHQLSAVANSTAAENAAPMVGE